MKNELLSEISSIAGSVIKKGIKITSEQLKLQLKGWLLQDEDYDTLTEVINTVPVEYQINDKIIEAYIETNATLSKMLEQRELTSPVQINQTHTGTGDNIGGDKHVVYHT